MNRKITLEQLLNRFPNGFSVSPTGDIFEVVETSKDPRSLHVLNGPGGFISVRVPDYKEGDDKFLGRKPNVRPATKDG